MFICKFVLCNIFFGHTMHFCRISNIIGKYSNIQYVHNLLRSNSKIKPEFNRLGAKKFSTIVSLYSENSAKGLLQWPTWSIMKCIHSQSLSKAGQTCAYSGRCVQGPPLRITNTFTTQFRGLSTSSAPRSYKGMCSVLLTC